MINHFRLLVVCSSVVAALTGCASTTTSTNTSALATPSAATQTSASQPVSQSLLPSMTQSALTLEKIMRDQEWLGRQPTNAGWTTRGEIVFEQKEQGSRLKRVFSILPGQRDAQAVPFEQLHLYKPNESATNADGSVSVMRYDESVYVTYADGKVKQLTKGGSPLRNFSFLIDGRIVAQEYDTIVAIDPETGMKEALFEWQFSNAPVAVKPSSDFIAKEQVDLIQYVAQKRDDRQAYSDRQHEIRNANMSMKRCPFYFKPNLEMVAVETSPNGKYAVFVTIEKSESRSQSDIMPHYIQENGRIATKNVRRRVADVEPENETIWLLDLVSHRATKIGYESLPGFNDDVLASVKQEVAEANGETYTPNRLPRSIRLIDSWNWTEPSIEWHDNGEQVALMLEAWDNKDRWIATIDLDEKRLVNQHRLHDDAWVNYRYNDFGWLHNNETLYYLSEHSGYSHLYTQQLGKAPRALTSGDYVVDSPVLTRDDTFIYFKANQKHPGVYEIYRVNTQTGEQLAMTDLNGMTDFSLSPDESQLLLTHSTTITPPELYLKNVDGTGAVTPLTHTVSEEFLNYAWTAPQIVAIPSSHTDKPIYARLYLPKGYESGEKRKAVVFNHGAGYLQNAHLGWSGYQREFMFHSMLAQQGYVVLDMDYRASAGYGRDWRTAIYRQMGTPEVQDLRDGVNWLVANANVDRERIGTYGGSYGGFLTFMSMFNASDLFQAGAALRPVSDWAHYNIGYTSNILNTPDVDPIAYRRSSPIYFAEGLEKPLLINAPMVDDNVFFVDVVRLVQRLIELEKQDFETAIYPVEPHGFVQPSSWLDEYRRIYKLFETHL